MYKVDGKNAGYKIYNDIYIPSEISLKKDKNEPIKKIKKSKVLPEELVDKLVKKATY